MAAAASPRRANSVEHLEIADQDVKVTNPDKVLYPKTGTTKAQVIDYYRRIAPALLPHVADRPVTLKRWPEGTGEPMFFQKSAGAGTPEWIPTRPVQHENSVKDYVLVENEPTLAWLGQMAALELHVPQWRFPKVADDAGAAKGTADAKGTAATKGTGTAPAAPLVEPPNPDRFVLDLDPGEGAGLAECAEVARLARPILQGMGLEPLPVTSGSKGIQLYAHLPGTATSAKVSEMAHELARQLERERPDLVVSDMKKTLRRGKVLVDWSQNNGKKTTIAPYSLRGRDEPTVAAPRTWAELDDPKLRQLTYAEVLERFEKDGDLLAGLDTRRSSARPNRHPAETTAQWSISQDRVSSGNSTKKSSNRSSHAQTAQPHPAPIDVSPMLASPTTAADQRMLRADADREEHQWAFEMKWDGDRALAVIKDDAARLISRNGIDLGARYRESNKASMREFGEKIDRLLAALEKQVKGPLPVVLDAELVALDDRGRPAFGLLRAQGGEPELMVFDVLQVGDRTLLAESYDERRAALAQVLPKPKRPINIPPAFDGDLDAALAASAHFGLEGVMAKRRAASYQPGARSRDWLKIKHLRSQEVVVVGWRPWHAGEPNEDIGRAGSLLLAVPVDGELRYVGKVGTGFTLAQRREVVDSLAPLATDQPAVSDVPRADAKDVRWVRPELVGEVEFAEWTAKPGATRVRTGDGATSGTAKTPKARLRHVSWRGWRPDKHVGDVVLE